MRRASRGTFLADLAGLGALLLFLLDFFRPSLLLLPTVMAGGDTPCHYPTLVWLYERLLPHGRLQGWYPGAYLGHPLLLYYFPLPFLLMAALAPVLGLPVAFKVGTAVGVFLVPLCAYAALRLMGFRFPGPLLGASAAVCFLFIEENPIWGGTIASTLSGEFAYTYGIALAALFLGVLYRSYARGRGPWAPGALLAITALAHGYAVLWAGLSATVFLYAARRPARTLGFLLGVAVLAAALAGFWLVPLVSGWGWTTPYDDPWLTVSFHNLLPPLLRPLLVLALGGLGLAVLRGRASGGVDQRLLLLAHSVAVAAALAVAAPALGIIDVRFVPFAHLAIALLAGASLGLVLQDRPGRVPVALALVLLTLVGADARAHVVHRWVEWDYSGLEAKELWPAFRELASRLQGSPADPRVAVEYSPEHEKAGSIRVYETLPLFTGRSTLEGVYNQAGLNTHEVYYLASELGATSPNPFRHRAYSRFDTSAAVTHLHLFNVSHVVAVSPKLTAALARRADVEELGRIPPYALFRLRDAPLRYVEPLAFAPVRSSPRNWREKAYRWFTRDPLSPAYLVFSDDARFTVAEEDEWLPPATVPLDAEVNVEERVSPEQIEITTSRVGHPLLVKVAYHPRWKAEGADGPYLISPALMMVVPRQSHVRLRYARTAADMAGVALTVGGLGALAFGLGRRRRAPAAAAPVLPADACALPPPPRRWGGAIPVALLVLLVLARLLATRPSSEPDASALHARAARAYTAERWMEAAELSRHVAALSSELRAEAFCLRGESLLRAGEGGQAAEAFESALESAPQGPYIPEALFGLSRAADAAGDVETARGSRERLVTEFSATPWARRAAEADRRSPAPP